MANIDIIANKCFTGMGFQSLSLLNNLMLLSGADFTALYFFVAMAALENKMCIDCVGQWSCTAAVPLIHLWWRLNRNDSVCIQIILNCLDGNMIFHPSIFLLLIQLIVVEGGWITSQLACGHRWGAINKLRVGNILTTAAAHFTSHVCAGWLHT